MSKILITGNGFDLFHNLPTTYSDFINTMRLVQHSDFDITKLDNEKFAISKDNNSPFDEKDLLDLKNLLDNNIWFNFFKTELELYSWIDFESKLEYVITILIKNIIEIDKSIQNNKSLYDRVYSSCIIKGDYDYFEDKILEFFNIITIDKNGSRRIDKALLNFKYNQLFSLNEEVICNNLSKTLDEFIEIFDLYFQFFIIPIVQNLKTYNEMNFNAIDEYFTFNYTPTFDVIANKNIKKHYIHGKIGNRNLSQKNNIVLGFDDIDEKHLNRKMYLPFTKYYQKITKNTDYKFIINYQPQISQQTKFYFLGHSLDASDKSYINEIFDLVTDHYREYQIKVAIFYYSEKNKNDLVSNLIIIRGRKNIESLLRYNALEFVELNNVNMKKEFHSDHKKLFLITSDS